MNKIYREPWTELCSNCVFFAGCPDTAQVTRDSADLPYIQCSRYIRQKDDEEEKPKRESGPKKLGDILPFKDRQR